MRGTPGERYRQKQLIRQVPAHDIDMIYCNNLSMEEKKQMEIFLRLRREKSLGKGLVQMKEDSDRHIHWVKVSLPLPSPSHPSLSPPPSPPPPLSPSLFPLSNCYIHFSPRHVRGVKRTLVMLQSLQREWEVIYAGILHASHVLTATSC